VWHSLQTWLADWRNPALVLAIVGLLYLARGPAERLIRAAFGLVGHGLRLIDRWILSGGNAAMAHHDRLKAELAAEESQGVHKSGHSTGTRFVFALVLMAAVGIAAWLNLALLERPMAELVGDSYSVMGVPLYRLAAMAIIVLEIAVGMVLLEALGGTTMFPQLARLEQQPRLRVAVVVTMATALVVLASIEAALALTRDEIARLERELMGTLAGAAPSDTAQSVSQVARYAQAAFGFVIPFALAFLGFAIELLVRSGRVVAQFALGQVLLTGAFLVRLMRELTGGLMAVVLALYEFAIFLPLYIERQVRKRST
jgi:hypothetical protein